MTYTSEYPPAQNGTYVKANYLNDAGKYDPWNATDPAKSLTGVWDGNMWYNLGTTSKFHIDLGSAKIIRRIYYEGNHNSGGLTTYSVKTFTLWGSNSSTAFDDLTYADDTGWTQLTIDDNTFDQHIAADQADPKYIVVDNSVSYRYYQVKVSDSWGGTNAGIRRIEFQTEDGYSPNTAPNTPTNSAPTDAATQQSRNPALSASAFSDADGGDTHAASQWQVFTDSGGSNKVWDSGEDASNLTSTTLNATNGTFSGALAGETKLALNTTYYWQVRYKDSYGNWSSYSTRTSFTTNAAPATPSISAPSNGATDVSQNPDLTGSAFSDSGDTHKASQWQVASDSGFSNVVWDSGTDTTHKTSTTVNASNGTFAGALNGATKLAGNTQYYVRVRYQDSQDEWSAYSSGISFTTINPVPATPTNSDPANDSVGVSRNTTLSSSAFSSPVSNTHQASQWQVFDDAGCTSKVWDSSTDTTNKTSTNINDSNGVFSGALNGETMLATSTKYWWKVRYKDSDNNWSAYSTATDFTTGALSTGSAGMKLGGIAGISIS